MANTLQLKNDIKKIKSALASKGLSATFKNKLKVKLQKAESDLKNSTPKGAKATLTSLKEQVKKRGYGVYKGAGVDLKKDAGEPALPIGRRVSKGLKGNQYGTKKGNKGNVYYEYRANRLDVKQPSKTAKYPKLAEGGEVGENGYVAFYKGKKMDVYAKTSLEARDKAAKAFGAKKAYDVTVMLAEKDGKQVTHSASFADGGMMAKGGENINQFQKYVHDGSKIAFAGGGNGTNITDYGLLEVAMYIDQEQYSIETRNLFKKLVISMVNDEIENNQVGANDYKKGGMMAHGGKLSKKDFFKKYEENEDENMHTENVVLLAENYGTESDIRDAKTILAKHESIGHLPTNLRLERDALHDKLYAKYVQSREDGGMMAKGGMVDYSKDGYVKAIRDVDGKLVKEVVIEDVEYRYNPIYKTYNSIKGNELLHKSKYADGGMMADGGVTEKEVVDSNAQMVLSNVKEVKHHADELAQIVTKKSNIEAWVVAKIERASTDLSDITHYLEGQHDKMSMGGSVYNHLHKMDKK